MRLTALVLLTAAAVYAQPADTLTAVTTRDRKIVRRWELPGDPRGVAIGSDGTIYAGVAEPQTVIAIDPKSGAIKKRLVLDSAEIASTKELVTLRTNPDRTRLFIANGSDESATILRLPDLAVMREITIEGETIRDVVADPRARHLYVLGRHVHVYDGEGETELRTLPIDDPMAIAVSANGALLAVLATEDFGSTKATVVALFDTNTFAEVARDPLQTEKTIEAAMFAAGDRSIIAFSRDAMFEKRITLRPTKIRQTGNATSTMRVDIGELVNSTHICLPEGSGPQIAALTSTDAMLVYAERRCSASGTFTGSDHGVTPASLYNVNAYAIAYDKLSNTLVATDRAGSLTIYNVPRPAQTN
ncbi:MAG: YncE family protein [Thermoanaerobaculia bacterium]